MASQFVEELAAFLGWEVDSTELKAMESQVEGAEFALKSLTVAAGVAAAGLTAFLVQATQGVATSVAFAQSVGVSTEKLMGLSEVLKPLGFDVESVVDLVEEMNNKIGESAGLGKPISAVADATKILNLEFQELKKLSPEDQFVAVLDAALKLEDVQQAVSAVDMLMGGEANKIVGFLRSQNTELAEQIAHYSQLNFLTKAGQDGAVAFDNTLNDLMFSFQSIGSEIAGLAGGALADLLRDVNEWIKANRELVKAKIKVWVDRITKALKWLWVWGTRVKGFIEKTIETLGGFENALKLVGIAIGSMITARSLIMIGKFVKLIRAAGIATALMNAGIALTPVIVAGVIALLGLLVEDLYHFFTGGESLVGEVGEKIAEFAHRNIKPFIASLLGMTPEEFDMAVVKVVDRIEKFFTEDIPNAWRAGVAAIEEVIKFAIEDLWPVINQIYDFFVDVFNKVLGLVSETVTKISDSIKDAIASIGGVSGASIGDAIKGRASVAAKSALGIGPGRQLGDVIKNIANRTNQAVNQQTNITVNQQPGENGEALARRVKTIIGQDLDWAVKATTSGIE